MIAQLISSVPCIQVDPESPSPCSACYTRFLTDDFLHPNRIAYSIPPDQRSFEQRAATAASRYDTRHGSLQNFRRIHVAHSC